MALDAKYKGKIFHDADCNESRLIEEIEWNPPADRFEAVTVKVYRPNQSHPGEPIKRMERWPYGISAQELPEVDRMIAAYTDWSARVSASNAQPPKAKAKAKAKKARAQPRRSNRE